LAESTVLYDKVLKARDVSQEQRVRSLLGKAEALEKLRPEDGQVRIEATSMIEDALRMARELGRTELIAECLHRSAFLSDRMGNCRAAITTCYEALVDTPAGRNDRLRVRVLNTLANALRREGKFAEAVRYHSEEIELKRRLGDRLGLQKGLVSCALVLRANNQPAEARKFAIEACELAACFGDTLGLKKAVGQLDKLVDADDEQTRRRISHWKSLIEDGSRRSQ
jgi:hypothetical protein